MPGHLAPGGVCTHLFLPRMWAGCLTCALSSLRVLVQEMSLIFYLSSCYLIVRVILFQLCTSLELKLEVLSSHLNIQHAALSQRSARTTAVLFPGEKASVNWLGRPSLVLKITSAHICVCQELQVAQQSPEHYSLLILEKLGKIRMKIELCFNQSLCIPT